MQYGKAGIRKDSWTHRQDSMLAEIVLTERRNGKTDTEAFAIAAPAVGRSVAACQYRWYTVLKHREWTKVLERKHWAYEPGKVIPIKQEAEKPMEQKHDPVKHPSHYVRNGLECIDVIKAAVEGLSGFEGYCVGNVIKYAWRWKQKNGIEDVRKAKQYIEFLENHLRRDEVEVTNR